MIEQYIEIVFNNPLASDTFLMGFQSPQIAGEAKPGQFVMIRVRSGLDPFLRRPFSICGTKGDVFLVLYRVVGRGTAIMAETITGDRLSVLGPLGRGFDIPGKNIRCILIAGGLGVAPLCFLAQKIRPETFMAGYGSFSGIIPLDRILEYDLHPSIATDDGTEGHAGPVTDLLEAYLGQNPSESHLLRVFTCGPEPMLKKVAEITSAMGISCQASLESHMACGLGACQGCAVKTASDVKRTYFHVCQDGPVVSIAQIDWNDV